MCFSEGSPVSWNCLRIGKCGLAGAGVSKDHARPSLSLQLHPVDRDLKVSAAAPAPCSSASHQDYLELLASQLNAFFYKRCLGHGVSAQQQNVIKIPPSQSQNSSALGAIEMLWRAACLANG